MGFKPAPRRYRLTFTGTDLEGLEVVASSVTVRQYSDLMAADNDATLAAFADHLVSWNLDGEDGQPVPADLDGVLSQDANLVARVITAWQRSLTMVPPTLPPPSANGAPPPELDLAALSQSLPS